MTPPAVGSVLCTGGYPLLILSSKYALWRARYINYSATDIISHTRLGISLLCSFPSAAEGWKMLERGCEEDF